MIVSIIVIPISIVSLLALNKDENETSLSVCKIQWYLAACTFLISILTLAVSRIEIIKVFRSYFSLYHETNLNLLQRK